MGTSFVPPPPAERIIVHFRATKDLTQDSVNYLSRARELTRAADTLGGQLITWAASGCAFAFEVDAVEELVDLIVSTLKNQTDGLFAVGLTRGVVELAFGETQRSELSWGRALLHAAFLAQKATGGQAVIQMSATDGWIHASPLLVEPGLERVVGKVGVLDLENPLRGDGTTPGVAQQRFQTPSTFDREEVDPEALAARLSQLSREALLGGDVAALERWSEGLKATGEKDQLAERMLAMARLSRGRVGDALRTLERVREAAESGGPSAKCQAALSYALGLAFAGRHHEALLEGMSALARADEAKDEAATKACRAFLARLFRKVGRDEDAKRVALASV